MLYYNYQLFWNSVEKNKEVQDSEHRRISKRKKKMHPDWVY